MVQSGSQLCHVWLADVVGSEDFDELVCQADHESLVVGSDDFDELEVQAVHEKSLDVLLVASTGFDELVEPQEPQPDSVELDEVELAWPLLLVVVLEVEAVLVVPELVVVVLQSWQ